MLCGGPKSGLSHSKPFRPKYVRVRGTSLGSYLARADPLEWPNDYLPAIAFTVAHWNHHKTPARTQKPSNYCVPCWQAEGAAAPRSA
jgi:hypothetical protein